MNVTYWHKQAKNKPLFPDLLWSRPEHKSTAGKLLIIGGNLHGFAAPAEAYAEAVKAGVGTARVLLPDAVQKLVGGWLENGTFADSTLSGSFSQKALAVWLDNATWADGVLVAGDLGRNSETAITLEKLLSKYSGQVTLAKDAVDYFKDQPKAILDRPDSTLVLSLAQLQKLVIKSGHAKPITFGMDLLQLVDLLHDFTSQHACNLVVKHLDQMVVASNGQISTTKLSEDLDVWRVKTAASASVWYLQNPSKPFEALTTAVLSN